MEAQELRVGNLVYTVNRNTPINLPYPFPMKILTIETTGVRLISYEKIPAEVEEWIFCPFFDICEIPLTEEWLLKFGFLDNGCPEWVKDLNNYNIGNDTIQYIKNDSWKCIKIRYVHQLQNLFFDLTGNELEIK